MSNKWLTLIKLDVLHATRLSEYIYAANVARAQSQWRCSNICRMIYRA